MLLGAIRLLVHLRLLRLRILLLLGVHLAIRLSVLLLLTRMHVLVLLRLVTGLLLLLLLLLWRKPSPSLHWHLLSRITAPAHG